jgi:hypothetical protein
MGIENIDRCKVAVKSKARRRAARLLTEKLARREIDSDMSKLSICHKPGSSKVAHRDN